ncbi:MAG: box helicase, partial [Gemmatimonadetes bacterium]|nr:box helicase [Gemmatimonadota bacterium]
MSLRDLAVWLLGNATFAERYERVVVEAARAELPPDAEQVPEEHDWAYLLLAASVLAVADEPGARSAALRIAQHSLVSQTTTDAQHASAATVLDTLANRPALGLAVRRDLLPADVARRLPLPARIEWMRHEIENTVSLANDASLAVNQFQRRFWSMVEGNDWVSLSAPTSAGKSFIITHWVVDFVRRHPAATVVYLVPTRALIGQVEKEFTRLVRDAGIGDVGVSSLPLVRNVVAGRANVLVLTQERFHILLTSLPDLQVDALVVDEAHKLGDGQRGVLLQLVIENVARRTPDAKVVFASPMTSNPEVLIADAPFGRRRGAFTSDEVTVNQNLLWVSQVPRHPRDWAVSLCLLDRRVPLTTLRLPSTPSIPTKRLSYVAHAIGQSRPGNIVYVNTASEAEKVAAQLWDLRGPEGDVTGDTRVAALIDLAQRTVHRDFVLARVLGRGVAFHYG